MSPDRFHECLSTSRLSQRGLARLLDVNERQVRRWAAGAPIPKLAADVLETLARFHERRPPPNAPEC